MTPDHQHEHRLPSNVPFGERFPALKLLGDLPIDSWHALPNDIKPFSVRTRNALRRARVQRWSQLLPITESEFAALPNVGVTSVNDLLRVITALEPHRFDADEIEANSPVLLVFEVPAVRLARQFTTQQIDALLTLRKWGEIGTETQSLGSILYESTPVPADVHTAVATILGAVIEPSPDRVLTLRSQAIELMAHLDERQALILRHRWIEEEGKTLEELGEILSVTRERVRQLETKGFDKISEQINTSLFDELRWAAWKVSNGLGTKAPAESQVTRDLVRSLCGLDLEDPAFEVIRLINRMQIKGGWFVTGSAPDVMAAFAHSAPAGFATLEEFDQILWTLGIERRFRDEILASEERLLVRLGHVIRRYLAVQDKAFAVLSIVNEPRSTEEILEILDEPYNLNSVRNALGIDDRFVRANRYEWALASWDVVPFTTVADAIADEINARGGVANLAEIVPIIVERGAVAPATVRAYATAPMFVLAGGTIRLRASDEPLIVEPSLDRTRNASMPNTGTLHLSVTVDSETLRGSGRAADWGLTATLGVQPGNSREFTFPKGSINVTWPMTGWQGGTIGSLRQLVLDAGASEGESFRITFDLAGSTVSAERTATSSSDTEM